MPVKKVTKKAATTSATAPQVVEKKVATPAPVTEKAPAKTPVAKKSLTTIVVKYDVGIGNSMILRGDGPGLSWDTGTVMENIDSETWQWTTSTAKSAFEIKFLINDAGWSQGENFAVKPGTTTGFSPSF